MRNAINTRPADDTPYRDDLTAHQDSEEKLRTFRLFEGMPEDAEEEERRPVHVAIVLFFAVVFWSFLIGAGFIYALKFGGWV